MPGMELIGHDGGRSDDDGVWEMRIEGPGPFIGRHGPVDAKAYCLADSMDARIGPSCADHRDVCLRHPFDRSFDRFLNRGLVRLALPACVGSAVIFENELDGRHVVEGYIRLLARNALMPLNSDCATSLTNTGFRSKSSSSGLEMYAISARMLGMLVKRST
jgi:hypothetical protein